MKLTFFHLAASFVVGVVLAQEETALNPLHEWMIKQTNPTAYQKIGDECAVGLVRLFLLRSSHFVR